MRKPTVKEAVAVRRAVEVLVHGFEGVVRVEAALAPEGPEVRVIVLPRHQRRIRALLPEARSGVSILVQVARKA